MPQPLPNPFQVNSYPTIQLCTVSILKGSSINPQKENDVPYSVYLKGLNCAVTPTSLPTDDVRSEIVEKATGCQMKLPRRFHK
jgi:hypothetical protein